MPIILHIDVTRSFPKDDLPILVTSILSRGLTKTMEFCTTLTLLLVPFGLLPSAKRNAVTRSTHLMYRRTLVSFSYSTKDKHQSRNGEYAQDVLKIRDSYQKRRCVSFKLTG